MVVPTLISRCIATRGQIGILTLLEQGQPRNILDQSHGCVRYYELCVTVWQIIVY